MKITTELIRLSLVAVQKALDTYYAREAQAADRGSDLVALRRLTRLEERQQQDESALARVNSMVDTLANSGLLPK